MPSIADRLFASHDDIRSVMLVDAMGNLLDLKSRTKQPVSKDFVVKLGSTWMTLIGSLVDNMQSTYGKAGYVHISFQKLHICSFPHGNGHVVFTARPTLSPDGIGKIIALAKSGS